MEISNETILVILAPCHAHIASTGLCILCVVNQNLHVEMLMFDKFTRLAIESVRPCIDTLNFSI